MGNASSTDEIKLGELIGEGSYGEVFKAVWNGRAVAAKRIRRIFFEHDEDGSVRQAFLAKFKSEWELLSRLEHPSIVKYHTVILPPRPDTPIIVTELLHCDLARFLRNSNTVPKVAFPDAVTIMLDVAEGLKYLHGLKPQLVHRDLASKNILLTRDKRAKIADMGLAKVFPHGAMMATAVPGTPVYAAPETYPVKLGRQAFASNALYTVKIDIFSFGALLLEVIIGHLPRFLPDPVLPEGEVIPEYIRRSEDLEEMGLEHPLHNIVLKCLENIPELRPSAESIADQLRKFTKKSEPRPTAAAQTTEAVSILHDYKFKIVILGESGVGKTCIVKRLLNPNTPFPDVEVPGTIKPGEHFERLQYRGKSVHLHIVDTAGQRRFNSADSLVPQIFRGVRGVVVVFDLTTQLSFLEVRNWLAVVKKRCSEETPLILVGNKTDAGERWVDSREASVFADKHKMFYIETSAKESENIDEMFSHLMNLMIQQKDARKAAEGADVCDSAEVTHAKGPDMSFLTPQDHDMLITARETSPRREFVSNNSITLDHAPLVALPVSSLATNDNTPAETPSQTTNNNKQTDNKQTTKKKWSDCCSLQ